VGQTLFGGYRNQFVYPLTEAATMSAEAMATKWQAE